MRRSEFFEIENSTLQESSARIARFGEELGHSKQAQNIIGHQQEPSTEKQDQQLPDPTVGHAEPLTEENGLPMSSSNDTPSSD